MLILYLQRRGKEGYIEAEDLAFVFPSCEDKPPVKTDGLNFN